MCPSPAEGKTVSKQDTALTADDANISTAKLVLFYVSYHLRRRLDKSKLIGLPEEYLRAPLLAVVAVLVSLVVTIELRQEERCIDSNSAIVSV